MATHSTAYESKPIRSMAPEDRRLLCRMLDVKDDWKLLACHPRLGFTREDIILLEQSTRAGQSPTDSLLHLMVQRLDTILDLYLYLKQVNLLPSTEIIKKYVPAEYHESQTFPSGGRDEVFVPKVEPMPPPLHLVNSNGSSLAGLSTMDYFMDMQGGGGASLTDSDLSSSQLDKSLTSDHRRALHTMIATKNFEFSDIEKATENFDKKYLIAEGHYGSVYRVTLFNTTFAAKRFNSNSYDCITADLQDTRNFIHPNIVPITGKSLDQEHVILLYEYMSNGSLQDHLRRGGSLPFDTRVSILLGAARGLQYLHANNPPLIHGNIKSSNILLDDMMKARLSDFGLAKHANVGTGPGNKYTHFSTRLDDSVLQRNRGYCAKEVLQGKPATKSDTYAFGVVILETCTSLPAYEPERGCLVDRVEAILENEAGKVWSLHDASIRWHKPTYKELFDLALKCTEDLKKDRPTMEQVFRELYKIENDLRIQLYPPDSNAPSAASQRHPPVRPPSGASSDSSGNPNAFQGQRQNANGFTPAPSVHSDATPSQPPSDSSFSNLLLSEHSSFSLGEPKPGTLDVMEDPDSLRDLSRDHPPTDMSFALSQFNPDMLPAAPGEGVAGQSSIAGPLEDLWSCYEKTASSTDKADDSDQGSDDLDPEYENILANLTFNAEPEDGNGDDEDDQEYVNSEVHKAVESMCNQDSDDEAADTHDYVNSLAHDPVETD